MYQEVRDAREANRKDANLDCIIQTLITDYPEDWLLCLEVLELAQKIEDKGVEVMAEAYLEEVKKYNPEVIHLIENGNKL